MCTHRPVVNLRFGLDFLPWASPILHRGFPSSRRFIRKHLARLLLQSAVLRAERHVHRRVRPVSRDLSKAAAALLLFLVPVAAVILLHGRVAYPPDRLGCVRDRSAESTGEVGEGGAAVVLAAGHPGGAAPAGGGGGEGFGGEEAASRLLLLLLGPEVVGEGVAAVLPSHNIIVSVPCRCNAADARQQRRRAAVNLPPKPSVSLFRWSAPAGSLYFVGAGYTKVLVKVGGGKMRQILQRESPRDGSGWS